MRLSLILPAYNEEERIGTTLSAIKAYCDDQPFHTQVIVASDGDDKTPQIVRKFARDWPCLESVHEPGRHGKGYGIRQGMVLATGDIVGFIDADYKTPIEEVEKLLPWLQDGYDVAIGSRGLADSRVEVKQPLYRQIGSRAFGLAMHSIVDLNEIVDTQCGFKFFKSSAGKEIFARTRIDGYMCDVEILWLAKQLGFRVKEVGIRWRDDGDSRLQLVRGNLQNALDLVRIRFHRYAR